MTAHPSFIVCVEKKMKHTRKREWFDDDSFWRDLYPFMFRDKRFADAAEQVNGEFWGQYA